MESSKTSPVAVTLNKLQEAFVYKHKYHTVVRKDYFFNIKNIEKKVTNDIRCFKLLQFGCCRRLLIFVSIVVCLCYSVQMEWIRGEDHWLQLCVLPDVMQSLVKGSPLLSQGMATGQWVVGLPALLDSQSRALCRVVLDCMKGSYLRSPGMILVLQLLCVRPSCPWQG